MNIFEDPKAFATPLLIQAFDIYGIELFDMEENVLVADLYKRYPKTNRTIINRLFAAIGLYTSDLFFQDPITFGQTCRAFNRHKYLYADEPSIKDICWGISEATLITSTDNESMDKFGEGIVKYIKHMLNYNGIVTNVPSLPFINVEDVNTSDNYDPLMDSGALENSITIVEGLEQYIQTNMIQCLNQIASLKVPLASEAREQLSQILKGE